MKCSTQSKLSYLSEHRRAPFFNGYLQKLWDYKAFKVQLRRVWKTENIGSKKNLRFWILKNNIYIYKDLFLGGWEKLIWSNWVKSAKILITDKRTENPVIRNPCVLFLPAPKLKDAHHAAKTWSIVSTSIVENIAISSTLVTPQAEFDLVGMSLLPFHNQCFALSPLFVNPWYEWGIEKNRIGGVNFLRTGTTIHM